MLHGLHSLILSSKLLLFYSVLFCLRVGITASVLAASGASHHTGVLMSRIRELMPYNLLLSFSCQECIELLPKIDHPESAAVIDVALLMPRPPLPLLLLLLLMVAAIVNKLVERTEQLGRFIDYFKVRKLITNKYLVPHLLPTIIHSPGDRGGYIVTCSRRTRALKTPKKPEDHHGYRAAVSTSAVQPQPCWDLAFEFIQ